MYKVGICGHFGGNEVFLDGQTIKTKTIYDGLVDNFGKEKICCIDTYKWIKSPVKLILKCFTLCKESENVIILPAIKGVKIFTPLFLAINKIFKRKLFYVVIGGWIPTLLKQNKLLLLLMKHLDCIFVETNIMKKNLENLGLNNIVVMPNFKNLNIVKYDQCSKNHSKPLKLCTCSRVMEEKGIKDAIDVVTIINEQYGITMYELDIYGQIDDDYKNEFTTIMKSSPEYINYKGVIPYEKTVETIKDYYLLLFPTYYYGEGFAGTIIDSFSAGVPVIASDWKYNSEIIDHKKNGFIYKTKDNEELIFILLNILKGQYCIDEMRKECIKKAESLKPQNVLKILYKELT